MARFTKEDYKLAGLVVLLFFIIFISSFGAMAGGSHHNSGDTTNIYNEYVTQEVISNSVRGESKGRALSNALSGIDCNMSSDKYHGGVAGGFYKDDAAGAIGVCKRFGGALIKFSGGLEDGEKGGHIGVMFNFN